VVVAPVAPPAAHAHALVNGVLAGYIGWCARLVAAIPGAQVNGARLVELLPLLIPLALAPFLRPPRLPRLAALVALIFVSLWTWNHRPLATPAPPSGLRVTFLDVGQGDSTLLQTKTQALLIDAGPPEAKVAEQLERLGVHRLSALVLTHPQRDHNGGAVDILKKLAVGEVLDPGIPSNESYELAARSEAQKRHVPVVLARAGQQFRLGALRLRVLWPRGEPSAESDTNESAIVTLASFGSVDFLLPSDAESTVTLPLGLGQVEVLKVAHHGSSDDGLPELLARLRPQLAVISVGLNNDYGHPTPSTLATLAADHGLRVYRTDLQGRVTVETDGHSLSVRTAR
jgi:competence protein ComEC